MEQKGFEAYEAVLEKDLKELNSRAMVLRHKKTGARVFLLSNDDENKVFTIGFRTPVTDDKGTPHIMEHSVLCGSRKFPVKDPFVELVKGSLNTFLNAMTYSDKTVYPVASVNDKDFQNLMDVYLDAVFHPNIYENEKIFMQEGWHYELTEEEGPLTINGVVYNEMKGVFSSPESVLDRYMKHSLFPDSPYRAETGGDPEVIPELTYEQFLDFHRKYYHPSNSYIYLYGNMDMGEKLEFIDREYLSHYEAAGADTEIPLQEGCASGTETEIFYPIGEDESEAGKTYLAVGTVVGTDLDPRLYVAFQILEYALLAAPGAPLKQALTDAGIGEDIYGGYESGILQPVFSVVAKNTDKDKKEAFLRIIRETLERLSEEGIGERSLEAGINYYEFKYREADFGSFPKGLIYGLQCFDSWLYDGDPLMHLEFEDTFAYLKAHKGDGYFEALITEYLLNNLHQSVIILSPRKGLDAEREKVLSGKLSKKLASMTAEERRALMAQTQELKKYQEEPSTEEALETIPLLSREDIGREAAPLGGSLSREAGIPVFSTDTFTSGIGYLRLAFDAGQVSREDWSWLGLLRDVLGKMSTEDHSYLELFNEINIETGGISPLVSLYPQPDGGGFLASFEFSAKAFYGKLGKALDFIGEIIQKTCLEDEKRLKELVLSTCSQTKERLLRAGHAAALQRAGSYHSAGALFGEAISGIEYYEFLRKLSEDFDGAFAGAKLRRLADSLFRREKLFVSITAEKEGCERFLAELSAFADRLPGGACGEELPFHRISKDQVALEQKNEGFKTSSQVQYVARCGNFKEAGYGYTGALKVLQVILSYDYLWIKVRVMGGAYGVMSGFGRGGDSYFVSYRDPHLKATYETFGGIPEYLENFEASDRDMTKYVIGTISGMDTPMTPYSRGVRNMSMYLSGITGEQLQRERDQVLNVSQEDIRSLAGIVRAILDGGNLCVLGGDGKIEASRELFKNVLRLS